MSSADIVIDRYSWEIKSQNVKPETDRMKFIFVIYNYFMHALQLAFVEHYNSAPDSKFINFQLNSIMIKL